MPETARPIPLIPSFRPERTLVRRSGERLSHEVLLSQVLWLARTLPPAPSVVNLCEDRGHFMLALCAALVRGVPCLLPPSRMPRILTEIAAAHPGALCLCDAPLGDVTLPQWVVDPPADLPVESVRMPEVDGERELILPFTSGSTGAPQAHPKCWADVMLCAQVAGRRFGIGPDSTLIATVPPQHMYGLELSVLIPLGVGAAAEAGRPFFPEDLRLALARVPPPRVLATTPVHLAACLDSMAKGWPDVDLVISATAPLSPDLARRVEQHLSTVVCEIYGCTEAGSIASRRTLDGPDWHWYDTVAAQEGPEGTTVTADFLRGPVPLGDILELREDKTFRLLGRSTDLVKVAGKRASLADLNGRLKGIEGVEDGVFVLPDEDGREIQRLAAVAVAPSLDRDRLMAALRQVIDPAFLPRTLTLVDRLPRNDTGKIPREALLALLSARGGEPS